MKLSSSILLVQVWLLHAAQKFVNAINMCVYYKTCYILFRRTGYTFQILQVQTWKCDYWKNTQCHKTEHHIKHKTDDSLAMHSKNAPFHKISSSAQCGRFSLILWRLVKGTFFYVLGQIVTWQYYPNLLDQNWSCTVIIDHAWQLRIWGPFH